MGGVTVVVDEVVDPATGSVIAEIPSSTADDVAHAVDIAATAFPAWSHTTPRSRAELMFEIADRHGFHFDTVQMPLNIMDAHYDSFEKMVVPMAVARGTGIIGMKAQRPWSQPPFAAKL